jgi:hypothetical protein
MAIKLSFTGVTAGGVAALDRFLASRGMSRRQADAGHVEGAGLSIDFSLDLAKGTLVLDLLSVPARMSAEHIEHSVQDMLDTGRHLGVAGETASRLGHQWPWG